MAKNDEQAAEPQVIISAQVPRQLRDAVIYLAAERDRSFSAEVRLALKSHVNRAHRKAA